MYQNYNEYVNQLKEIADTLKVYDGQANILDINNSFNKWIEQLNEINQSPRAKIIFIGNGGSAGISSHCATDYLKNGKIRSMSLNDSATITCLSNDYSYEEVFSKQIEFHGFENDLLIAISSSGMSANIINACNVAREKKMRIITLSGFESENSLISLGDINYYINSKEYGFVEILHLTTIHAALDLYLKRKQF